MEKLQLTKPTLDVIGDILSRFNFEKVHAYMVLTGWKWKGEQPTMEDLFNNAHDLLWRVTNIPQEELERPGNEGFCIGTGGFYAYRFVFDKQICFKLTFEPCHSSNF